MQFMTREQAKNAPDGDTTSLVVNPAAWPWIVDAIYDRGLFLFDLPEEDDALPTFCITAEM